MSTMLGNLAGEGEGARILILVGEITRGGI